MIGSMITVNFVTKRYRKNHQMKITDILQLMNIIGYAKTASRILRKYFIGQ